MQYFCFANYMRGSTLLTHLTEPLRWVTLYWPLPWHMSDPTAPHRRHLFEGAMSHGVELWGDSLMGDVTDVRNACGALFWSSLLFILVLAVHAGTILHFLIRQRSFTFPHRMRLGNWESRFLHWLSFPACTAAANVLAHSATTTFWKVIAGVVLAVYFCWILAVFISMHLAVKRNQICWVWHTSVREDGELEDEAGYWNDVVCDQLTTHPVNRSLCKWFFNWKWISTVADLEPVNIHPNLFKRKHQDVYPPQEYGHSHSETSFPQAKTPKTVEVVRTRKAMSVFPGQRLIAGLLRTQWLDILFTYQGLIRLHTEVVCDTGRELIVPVTVKTHQLTGPVTAGANAYFFDGARVPFVRVFDSFFRVLLGVFLGISLASTRHSVDAMMFGLIGGIALLSLVYMAVRAPYTRRLENWLEMAVFMVITLSAGAFLGYAVAKKEPSVAADAMLWLVAVCCLIVSAYSLVVTFSVFSAILCPPLDESRFLEKLANCNVTLSDHNAGWAVDVPAYSKYGVRDLKASYSGAGGRGVHVSMYPSGDEPTLEFSVKEIKHACRTGALPTPVLTVFAPSHDTALGYRCCNVFDRANIVNEVSRFLASDTATASSCEEVARQINHHVHLRGKGKTILSVTLVPSSSERKKASHSVSVRTDSTY
ncbi:MAG: hypothetical protein KVP17_005163 [Porospora cf. gigantea B]|uniref:uncharacterized protein n=1 Tax=Porospora cf. gigantea B TaxID=2853592 RepID=UPI0035718FD2|nr:MAG: hypothetical protein KVP17_005163 [Porospora cf. gigantea B]